MEPADHASGASGARERILAAAYGLFLRRGVRAVGVNELIREAGTAKATLYYHFPAKEDLILAFLEHHWQVFIAGHLHTGMLRRGATAEGQLLAGFDVLEEWFHHPGFETSPYFRVLFELGPRHRLGQRSRWYLERIRAHVQDLAGQADLADPEGFAHAWMLLIKGAIVAATEGDAQAARRARPMAEFLLAHHRTDPARPQPGRNHE